jgi:RNA polymerase sigma-70 factor, ECF subfamily
VAFLAKFFREGDADSRYDRCGAAELGLTRPEFSEMLEDVIRRSFPQGCSGPEREQFLQGLRLEDLALARACARGVERAWGRFLLLYREKMYRAAGAITGEESAARELADSVYADLFGMRVEGGKRRSKLDSYLGRGSLEGWLRTVLAQEYVNRYRRERRLVSFEEVMEVPVPGATYDVPSSERAQVEKATDAALAALSPEDQFLLAVHYLDGRTMAEIGQMLKLHESTISRRLEKITSGLRKSIVKELCRSGMSKREAEEILEMDVRDMGIDVRNRLAQERRGEPFPR